MMEVEKHDNTRGIATGGLTTGIIGTALGVLNGGLGNVLGGTGWNNCNGAAPCSENMLVNRYELAQNQKISELQSALALRDANTYGDQKLLEVYKYFDGQIKDVRDTLCAQAVTNQKTADSFALASADLAAVKQDLCNRIALEAERRCCADNAIVTYANATFYPKMVADVTVGTATTAQMLYNPIPDCGCGCGK